MSSSKTIEVYQTQDGKQPFELWLKQLKDVKSVARIRLQMSRLKLGLLGDTKPVGNSVHELRIHLGKGYRVYYVNDGQQVILLLCGGSKSTQSADIQQAKEFWNDYKARKKN